MLPSDPEVVRFLSWAQLIALPILVLGVGATFCTACQSIWRTVVSSKRAALWLVALLFLSSAFFWCAFALAAEFPILDSAEYSIGAWRFLQGWGYSIPVGNATYPPRYTPWFSIVALMPLQAITQQVGAGILAVLLSGLLIVLFAGAIGALMGGERAALAAALAVLCTPGLRYFGQHVLIDVPFTMLSLGTIVIALEALRKQRLTCLDIAVSGILAAAMVALRMTGLIGFLPIVYVILFGGAARGRCSKRYLTLLVLALLVLPLISVLLATGYYQGLIFGSVFRNGYNYWLPIPYDYPALTFSISALAYTFRTYFIDAGIFMLVVVVLIACILRRRLNVLPALRQGAIESKNIAFVLLAAIVPLTVFHLFYFYHSIRFILPVTTLLAAMAGALLAPLVARCLGTLSVCLIPVFFIVLATALLYFSPRATPRQDRMQLVRSQAGEDALIIASSNPAFVQSFWGTQTPEILPLSRRVDYANLLIAPRYLGNLEVLPNSPIDHRFEGVRTRGALDPFPDVLFEAGGSERVRRALTAGRKVLLETGAVDQAELALLRQQFQLEPRGEGVFQLSYAAPNALSE